MRSPKGCLAAVQLPLKETRTVEFVQRLRFLEQIVFNKPNLLHHPCVVAGSHCIICDLVSIVGKDITDTTNHEISPFPLCTPNKVLDLFL